MGRSTENAGFRCAHCGRDVVPQADGSYRNHCPFCLYSKHVDMSPGDRECDCGGLMEPVRLRQSRKGFQIEHKCLTCGFARVNRVAGGLVQPDDIEAIVALMQHRHAV